MSLQITCHKDTTLCNVEYIGYTNWTTTKRFKEHNTTHNNN